MSEQQLEMTQQGFDDGVELEALLDNLDHLENDPRLWPKTLADMIPVIESQIKRGSDQAEPARLARDITAAIAHYLGGRQIYLPRDSRLQRALRDHSIFTAFTGNNHQQLADEHGLTAAQIYNILAQQTKLHRARVQPQLVL